MDEMEKAEKTFRYSYIFKNVGVFYLMFLFSCVFAGLFMGQKVFMLSFLPIALGFGLIFLLIPYLTSRVSISDLEITTKSLLVKKSLQWSEIGHFSSRGSSTRLHHYDGSRVLSIGSRLDGYTEIFELLHQKRPDLFDIDIYKSFTHKMFNAIAQLAIGIFLVVLGLAGYFSGIEALISTLIFGFIFTLVSIWNWYSSPRVLTLGQKSLEIGYLQKTESFPISDIADIKFGGQQQIKSVQINSVLVLLKNRNIINLSGYNQSPGVMYFVLKRWLQKYSTEPKSTS